jgi:segregation and condensation protein A
MPASKSAKPGKRAEPEPPASPQDAPEDEQYGETEDSEFDEAPETERLPGKGAGGSGLDLERLVSKPAWKEVLLELVVREGLDPWDIDVGVIAEKYLERVKKMKALDLHIPANLILAASILLRFKSDSIRLEEEVQEAEAETFIGEDQQPVEIPVLTLRTRIPPKRKVTLEELVGALEDVFSDQKRREDARNRPVEQPKLVVQLPEFDIERQMDEVFARVKAKADSEGLAVFSALLENDSREEKIYTLLPLLFLSQSGKVSIFQEKIFGEIFVQLLPADGGETPREPAKSKGAAARAAKA